MEYCLTYRKFFAIQLQPCILNLVWGCILTGWIFTSLAQGSTHPQGLPSTNNSGDSILSGETRANKRLTFSPVYISVVGGAVSVQIEEVPLGEVLNQVGTQGNIKVKISGDEGNRKISEHFSSLPMEKALHRLLRGTNYALIYRNDENNGNKSSVTSIVVMNPGEEAPAIEEPQGNEIPSIHDDKPDVHAIIQSLDLDSLPIGVKAALIDAVREKSPEIKQAIEAQRSDALTKLLEHLKKSGVTETDTIRQLREHINKQKIPKINNPENKQSESGLIQ